jgi:hypothetical protein
VTIWLVLGAAVAAVVAFREHGRAVALERQALNAGGYVKRERTGLLTRASIGLRLAPELQWAQLEEKSVALLVLRLYAIDPTPGMRALGRVMRGYENAFEIEENEILVALWDSGREAAVLAAARLSDAVASSGTVTVLDVGIALVPDDSRDFDEALQIARERLRPADDYAEAAALLRAEMASSARIDSRK